MFRERLIGILSSERFLKKFNQSSLADLLGVPRNRISSWKGGVSEPSLSDLAKLAKALGVTSDYLIGLSDVPISNAAPEIEELIKLYDALPLEQKTEVRGFIKGILVMSCREAENK